MIEAGLVYIHFDRSSSGFAGCGALVEGPFIVTCRHVWDQARQAARGNPVLVCFPPQQGNGEPMFSEATLADDCNDGARPPDLLILEAAVPAASAALSVERSISAETGPAAALAVLYGRDPDTPVLELTIPGTISPRIAPSGLRQFTGGGKGYWFDRGSSGSPLGLDNGTTLAGILCISEIGRQPGAAEIHEAFLLPASTIHRFLRALVGRRVAGSRDTDIDIGKMPEILDLLGASELSLADLRRRLDRYFDNVEARAGEIVEAESAEAAPRFVEGATAALAGARALSDGFEPAAAMAVLDKALADEARTSGQSLLLLLIEKARQQQLFLDHQGAIACLSVITVLSPDSYREWISLGDTQQRVGNLKAAIEAYRGGLGAAGRADRQSDLATAHQRIGAALRDMGDLAGALAEARASLGITQRIARQDVNQADLQRELAVSHNSVGIILADLGDPAGALQEFNASLAIGKDLRALDPDQARWQHDLSISHERIGRVLLALDNLPAALDAFQSAAALRQTLSERDPGNTEWQRELGVSHHKVGETHRAQALLDANAEAEDRRPQAQQSLAAALASFRAALAAFEPLAEGDPDNAELQRDVSAAHSSIGGILLLQGDRAGALAAYRKSLTIVERQVDRDPDRADWQRDLLVSCERMASASPDGRRAWISRALGIATRLAERGRLGPNDTWMIANLQARLAALPPDTNPGVPASPG